MIQDGYDKVKRLYPNQTGDERSADLRHRRKDNLMRSSPQITVMFFISQEKRFKEVDSAPDPVLSLQAASKQVSGRNND